MPQISLPSYGPSRTKTRTYDVKADPATVIAALLQLVAPTGSLVPTLSESEPGDGWKLCNGQSLLKFEYPDLFAAIGGTWGETADTFALPDFRGRLPIGAGGSAGLTLKAAGGAHQIVLTQDQMPPHAHDLTDPGHTHTFSGTPHAHGVTDPGHSHTAAVVAPGSATSGPSADGAATGSTSSEVTGITVDAATAGGTNATSATGIAVQSAGAGSPVTILPPVIAVNWLVRT